MKKKSWRRMDGENKIRIENGRWRRVSREIRMEDKNREGKMEMKKG